jgi:hypothetical protein
VNVCVPVCKIFFLPGFGLSDSYAGFMDPSPDPARPTATVNKNNFYTTLVIIKSFLQVEKSLPVTKARKDAYVRLRISWYQFENRKDSDP